MTFSEVYSVRLYGTDYGMTILKVLLEKTATNEAIFVDIIRYIKPEGFCCQKLTEEAIRYTANDFLKLIEPTVNGESLEFEVEDRKIEIVSSPLLEFGLTEKDGKKICFQFNNFETIGFKEEINEVKEFLSTIMNEYNCA